VTRHLAGRLGTSVRLRSAVRSVEHDQDGVRVLTDDGEVTGDAVILAVPMAVLRALPFSPEVPRTYRSAWQRAGLAHNAKLHMPLTRPAAASAVQSVPDRFWTWTAADGSGQIQPVLHAFGGTEEGLAALAVAEGPATWASRATALRPELSADPSRAMLTTWNDDPWAGESYSALTVAVADGDDDLIAAPLGRVRFAGEHTAGAWAGLMEGALSVQAQAEGVSRRIEKHPEGCAGLMLVLGRAEVEHRRLGGVEVIDDHVEVHLLRHLLSRPPGWGIPLHLLEGEALTVVRADVGPVGADLDLPVQHRAVERRESARIGTVDDDAWEACDSHAGTVRAIADRIRPDFPATGRRAPVAPARLPARRGRLLQ